MDNTYPKEYTKIIQSKGSVIVELKVILYAITELFNILISIELLSHVLNNVPQLLQKLLARIDFNLHLKFDFHV